METEQVLDLPVVFDAAEKPVEVRLASVRGERDGRWRSLTAIVETDVATAARGYFHDTPENRLEEVQGGFNTGLPVLIELALRDERLAALPPADEDLRTWLGSTAAGELWREDAWNAVQVWQEHPLDPSIGGGAIKVGYRTVFSAPRNEIDRLKRRGPVSRTVVEALIESGIPVRFADDAFEFGLGVGESAYQCRLRADDAATALSLSLSVQGDAAPGAIADVNRELPAGAFAPGEGELRYVSEIRADPALVSPGWVIETLRAAVSIMHHYAPRLLGAGSP
jgi:hypothetical protein